MALPVAAHAQYVATFNGNVPYPTLTNPQPIVLLAAAGTPNDRGRATVPIGFTFPYYNKTYTSLIVTANGMAFLEPSSGSNLQSDFFSNVAMPNVSEPNGVLAVVWDDLNGRNPNSAIQSQALSGPNGHGLAVEWFDWNHFVTSSYSLTFQLRIWENGIVEYYYGAMTGNGGTMTATVGIESPDGSGSTYGLGCSPSCAETDFTSNSRISYGPPAGADLQINYLRINSVTLAGPDLIFDTSVSIKNFGTVAANNFTYRLYLSADTVIDATDFELNPTPQGPVSVGALSSIVDQRTTSVLAPSTGSWYLLALVDDANVIAETNENNNNGATAAPLAAGVDLFAQSISGPQIGGPGDTIQNEVVFSNLGFNPAGNVPVAVWLSADNALDSADTQVFNGTLPVAGGETVDTTVSFVLPNTVPAGAYYFILQLDDGPNVGQVVEISETNNTRVSAQPFTAEQADLFLEYVEVHQAFSPFALAPYAFFGEGVQLVAKVSNIGGATSPNTYVLFFMSDNNFLSAINDPQLAQVGPFSLGPQSNQLVTVTATLPSLSGAGQPLVPGSWFFFAAAQASNLVELSAQNNAAHAPPLLVRDPAPDLAPTQVVGPSGLGAGEDAVVQRSLANIGNRPAGTAKYRYYLSANPIITESDILLPMLEPDGGTVIERTVTLDAGQVDSATELVQVPLSVAPATYYLGVLIDPPGPSDHGEVDEVDEANNGLASQTVKVAGPALGLLAPTLPDGVVGLPYQGQLGGTGGDGTYSLRLANGSTLPGGLTMGSDGIISGVPTTAGAYGFMIDVTSAGVTVSVQVTMRVTPPTGSLVITTQTLPSPARTVVYRYQLGAQGGRGPYTWTVLKGGLPAGVSLDPIGVLGGQCTAIPGTEFDFTLGVRDASGNLDSRDYAVVVVDPSALLLNATSAPSGVVGQQYLFDVTAANANMAPPFLPFTWEMTGGGLPPGVVMQPSMTDRLLLTGVPTVAGVYSFTLDVTDVRGRSQSADIVLRIDSPGVQIVGDLPAEALRGTEISLQLTLMPDVPGAVFDVRDGVLPPGVSLSADGKLSGKIADDAPFMRDTFTVQVGGSAGVTALRSFSVDVVKQLTVPTKSGCGCNTGSGGLAFLVLLMLARKRPLSRG